MKSEEPKIANKFRKSALIWVILIIVILCGLWISCRNRITTDMQIGQKLEQTQKEATKRIEKIETDVKAIPVEAKKKGDEYVKKTLIIGDDAFLDELNAYSDRMVERAQSVD